MVLEDPVAMCKANSEAADELGNPELARIWQLASKVALAASEIGENTSCLSNILFKKNIPNILFQGKIFFYIVI